MYLQSGRANDKHGAGAVAHNQFLADQPCFDGFAQANIIGNQQIYTRHLHGAYKWIKDGIEPPMDTRTAGIMITRDNYEELMRQNGLTD